MYQIEFLVPRSASLNTIDTFSEVFENVSVFESEDKQKWVIRIILERTPPEDISDQIRMMVQNLGLPQPHIDSQELPSVDWLAENRKSFPALNVAGFYIYGSHLEASHDPDLIPLQLDASLAFGTGKHATTQGCLELIKELEKPNSTASVLDLGCGTAILAMAMAKLWNIPVLACDIDPDSVRLATLNCGLNHVDHLVSVVESDGFNHPLIQDKAPFDLIVANILAEPLQILAPLMNKYTTSQASLILSGLLVNQIDAVTESYQENGFKLVETKIIEDWAALGLKKLI